MCLLLFTWDYFFACQEEREMLRQLKEGMKKVALKPPLFLQFIDGLLSLLSNIDPVGGQ